MPDAHLPRHRDDVSTSAHHTTVDASVLLPHGLYVALDACPSIAPYCVDLDAYVLSARDDVLTSTLVTGCVLGLVASCISVEHGMAMRSSRSDEIVLTSALMILPMKSSSSLFLSSTSLRRSFSINLEVTLSTRHFLSARPRRSSTLSFCTPRQHIHTSASLPSRSSFTISNPSRSGVHHENQVHADSSLYRPQHIEHRVAILSTGQVSAQLERTHTRYTLLARMIRDPERAQSGSYWRGSCDRASCIGRWAR